MFSTFLNPSKPVPKRVENYRPPMSSSGGGNNGAPKGSNIRGMDALKARGGACGAAGGG